MKANEQSLYKHTTTFEQLTGKKPGKISYSTAYQAKSFQSLVISNRTPNERATETKQ